MTEKILIAEDDTMSRENIIEILDIEGYESVSTGDGTEVLPLALSCKPDLILCDLSLINLDGIAVCQQLRAESATAQIPILILSAHATQRDIKRALNAGASSYMVKPFHIDQLIERIKELLR